jgi:chromosome partitioning protein
MFEAQLLQVSEGEMGLVVTVMNMKGGVGKTTVCAHLAGYLARYKAGKPAPLRVLAIDYDPQFNLSQLFIPAKKYFELEQQRKSTIAILMDDDAAVNPYELQVPGNHTPPSVTELIYSPWNPKMYVLDIVPSTLDLMYVALGQANASAKPMEERFEKFIDECRKVYDLVLIDCHPAGSLFTKTSLNNSDHVLIPVAPERFAVRGIGLMMRFIEAKKKGGHPPKPHILFNRTARSSVSAYETDIRANKDYAPYCMSNTLKKYTAFSDPEQGQGFVWVSGKPYSTEAFINLMKVGDEFRGLIGI